MLMLASHGPRRGMSLSHMRCAATAVPRSFRLSRQAKRKIRRHPTSELALLLATKSDDSLVQHFMAVTRQVVREDDVVLRDGALTPLVALCRRALTGELARADWESEIAQQRLGHHPGPPMRTSKELLNELRRSIPLDAHLARLRRVIETLPSESNTDRSIGATITLLRGAVTAGCVETQRELLARLRELVPAASGGAEDSMGILSLVQAPLLCKLGADEARLPPSRWWCHGARLTAADCLLAAAEAARQEGEEGVRHGMRHGCIIVTDDAAVTSANGARLMLGVGWNHKNELAPRRWQRLHAERHAIMSAIKRHGRDAAFDGFSRATAWIVELSEEAAYDDAHPCPHCNAVLRAVGVRDVRYTTGRGLASQRLGPPLPQLLNEIDHIRDLFAAEEPGSYVRDFSPLGQTGHRGAPVA
jgi:tRNA(Arg) A34 adenosine deaminase TadA